MHVIPALVLATALLACGSRGGTPSAPHLPGGTGGNGGTGGSGGTTSDEDSMVAPGAIEKLFDRGSQGPKGLHASAQVLYWYESNFGEGPRVLRAPKHGGAEPQVIAETEPLYTASFIASDPDHVYWVESESVELTPHDGGDVETIALGRRLSAPTLVIDGGALFVADLGCFKIARIDIITRTVTMLRDEEGTHDGGLTFVVTDERDVYCSTGNLGSILALPKAGGAIRTVAEAAAGHGIAGVTRIDDALYFLQIPSSLGQAGQSVVRVAVGGGGTEALVTADVRGAGSALVRDSSGTTLYWISGVSAASTLYRYELRDGALSTVVTERNLSGHLTADAERVYWAELDPSAIFASRF